MKHILDWYNENTPQNEDEYEKGCLTSAAIIAIIFIALTVKESKKRSFQNKERDFTQCRYKRSLQHHEKSKRGCSNATL